MKRKATPTKAIRVPTRRAATRKRQSKNETVALKEWYSSEEAKRNLGTICQAVNEQGSSVELLGTEDRPYICLVDAKEILPADNEVLVTIEEAKADWPAVTAAALFYGTAFRIRGKRVERAVLYRHPTNRHGAVKYRRPQVEDISQSVSAFLEEVRRVSEHFDSTTTLIERHFKEVGRNKNDRLSRN